MAASSSRPGSTKNRWLGPASAAHTMPPASEFRGRKRARSGPRKAGPPTRRRVFGEPLGAIHNA
eukprot:scaffold98261_cov72-Phaeocystis_antarctica.AAC.2